MRGNEEPSLHFDARTTHVTDMSLILEADIPTPKAALYINSVYVSGLPARTVCLKPQAVQKLEPESSQYAGRMSVAGTFLALARVAVLTGCAVIGGFVVDGRCLGFG